MQLSPFWKNAPLCETSSTQCEIAMYMSKTFRKHFGCDGVDGRSYAFDVPDLECRVHDKRKNFVLKKKE